MGNKIVPHLKIVDRNPGKDLHAVEAAAETLWDGEKEFSGFKPSAVPPVVVQKETGNKRGHYYKSQVKIQEEDPHGIAGARNMFEGLENMSDELIEHLSGMVKNLAFKFARSYSADMDEMVMVGMNAVAEAARNFDQFTQKCEVSTYVNYHARAEMVEALSARHVVIEVEEDFSNHSAVTIRDAAGNLKEAPKPEPTIVRQWKQVEVLESELPLAQGEEERSYHEKASVRCPSPEMAALSDELWAIVDSLPQKYAATIRLFFEEGLTLDDIAKALGFKSRQRVGQIKNKAIAMLRDKLDKAKLLAA